MPFDKSVSGTFNKEDDVSKLRIDRRQGIIRTAHIFLCCCAAVVFKHGSDTAGKQYFVFVARVFLLDVASAATAAARTYLLAALSTYGPRFDQTEKSIR